MSGFAEDRSTIDHVAEARKHIDWAHEKQGDEGDTGNVVRDDALIAQAEATLALVEEQRIANLIAYGNSTHPHPDREPKRWAALYKAAKELGL